MMFYIISWSALKSLHESEFPVSKVVRIRSTESTAATSTTIIRTWLTRIPATTTTTITIIIIIIIV